MGEKEWQTKKKNDQCDSILNILGFDANDLIVDQNNQYNKILSEDFTLGFVKYLHESTKIWEEGSAHKAVNNDASHLCCNNYIAVCYYIPVSGIFVQNVMFGTFMLGTFMLGTFYMLVAFLAHALYL